MNLDLILHDPTPFHIELTVDAAEKIVHVQTKSADNRIVNRQDYPVNESGARAFLSQLGIDPKIFGSIEPSQMPRANISARLSCLKIRGESVDTYAVDVTQNEQTLIEMHIS